MFPEILYRIYMEVKGTTYEDTPRCMKEEFAQLNEGLVNF